MSHSHSSARRAKLIPMLRLIKNQRCYLLPTANLLILVAVASLSSRSTNCLVQTSGEQNATTRAGDANGTEPVLLSGEEFVDSREVPSILIDGTRNEDENEPRTTSRPASESTTTTSKSDAGPSQPSPSNGTESPLSEATTKEGPGTEPPPAVTTTTLSPAVQPPSSNGSSETPSGGNEEDEDEDQEDDAASKDSSSSSSSTYEGGKPFEPPQNISQYMDYIEKLFHDLRHQITDLFEPHLPQLIRTSQMVELSSSCSYDMLRMALALRQFEPWALRMIDSSGKVPEGIFEGTFTALGSYDECLNTVFQSSSSAQGSGPPASSQESSGNRPTQGQYCLVTVSPFMPPKPPADRVDRLFQEEANRRNYTRDDQFSRLSPMFYYMKFRIGVCIPSSCDQSDMDSIAGALSSSLRLNITIPDCRVRRAHEPLTSHQLWGGLIFGFVCASVLAATLADCFKLKSKQIRSQELELVRAHQQHQQQHYQRESSSLAQAGKRMAALTGPARQEVAIRMAPSLENRPDQVPAGWGNSFGERLAKHWAWMSFSLLTNFRLFFRPHERHTETDTPAASDHRGSQQMVGCLNGIRVLSLCWVIVANSYLTLDPRATKRLTKTREAPRDFLFQVVVQASLAIETFFFLSGLLMSLSYARRLSSEQKARAHETKAWPPREKSPANPEAERAAERQERSARRLDRALRWVHFYVHRYVRMTPPTMLVIAFSMFAYHYGDGPLWFEATQRVHQSCTQNWWRHLLHVANFIDTRQMCFIHYWYIAADMQLFLFAPVLMFLLYRHPKLGYLVIALVGSFSVSSVFYTTYARNLPPTLLFYSTDPESRREFGNTIMTKPFTHALPYLVGMLVGWYFVARPGGQTGPPKSATPKEAKDREATTPSGGRFSLTGLLGTLTLMIALVELFLPYKWNNSHLPSRLMASTYAALFRFGWSLVLAFVVVSCRHVRTRRCSRAHCKCATTRPSRATLEAPGICTHAGQEKWCFCGSGGSHLNRFLSLGVFAHLSKLSFVAYLVHLPLMSVFIGQTRGLFAFSHTLVVHFAISYLVMSFALAFVLVHVIEFPFITFERLLFERLFRCIGRRRQSNQSNSGGDAQSGFASHSSKPPIMRLDPRSHPLVGHGAPRAETPPSEPHRTKTGATQNTIDLTCERL